VSVPWKSTGQWRDVQIWLLDNVPNHKNYEFVGMEDADNQNNRVYYFAHQDDAVLFALRWA
jgi:hypothetical protein